MTIAIGLKVGDGIVLGADSAATVDAGGQSNVYFNAEKVFNLVCDLPIGAVSYGLFGFGNRSTTKVIKDLRAKLENKDSEIYVDPETYTMEEVSNRTLEFFKELYDQDWGHRADDSPFGFIIAGYSANSSQGEMWKFDVDSGDCDGPIQVTPPEMSSAAIWDGQGEPLDRLVRGWSHELVSRMMYSGMEREETVRALDDVAPIWNNAMPIQDAIDLVRYLVETTIGYYRFSPGHQTVAAPVDLAAITLHEGFRWVSRKHYYPMDRNVPFPVVHVPSRGRRQ